MKQSGRGRLSALIVIMIVATVLRVVASINPIAGFVHAASGPIDGALAALQLKNTDQFIEADEVDTINFRKLVEDNDTLRQQLDSVSSEQSVLAQVEKRDVSSLRKHVWVAVGSNNGVALNDPVLHDGFLIGLVDEVFDSKARVQLVIDAEFRLTVEADKHHGLLTEEAGSVIIKHIDDQALEGSIIRTDGLANRVRPGIPVGVIGDNVTSGGDVLQSYSVLLHSNPFDVLQLEILAGSSV